MFPVSPIWMKFSINQALNRDIFDLTSKGLEQEIEERYTRMRDRCFELVKNSNTDFPAYHIVSKPGEKDPADGIAVYEVGYCRLLRDEVNQVDVDVFSTNIESLHRKTDGAQRTLAEVLDDPDVYVLGAYDSKLSGKVKRERREDRLKEIRQNILYNEQFYMEAVPLNEKDLDGQWGFRIANQSIAFAMRPLEDGKWRIWARPALNGENGGVDEFVRLPKKMPEGVQFSFLSEGQLECKDFETAFEKVQQLACKAAMNHRKGIPDLVAVEEKESQLKKHILKPVGKHLRDGIKTVKSIVTRPYMKGVAIGTSVGAAYTAAQTLTSEGATAADLFRNVGVGAAVGWGLKFVETVIEQVSNKLEKAGEQERLNARKDITEKDYSALYIAKNTDNDGRFLKKADPEKIRDLRALSHHQAQMAHDSLDECPENWVYSDDEKLTKISSLNMVKRIFGNVIARPGLMNMMWVFYPNGGRGFRHVNMQDDSTTVQAAYKYDEGKVIHKRAPKDMIDDLRDGQTKLITYHSGAPNRMQEIEERALKRPVNTTKLEHEYVDDARVHEVFEAAVLQESSALNIADINADFLETVDPFSVTNIAETMIRAEKQRRANTVNENQPTSEVA